MRAGHLRRLGCALVAALAFTRARRARGRLPLGGIPSCASTNDWRAVATGTANELRSGATWESARGAVDADAPVRGAIMNCLLLRTHIAHRWRARNSEQDLFGITCCKSSSLDTPLPKRTT